MSFLTKYWKGFILYKKFEVFINLVVIQNVTAAYASVLPKTEIGNSTQDDII